MGKGQILMCRTVLAIGFSMFWMAGCGGGNGGGNTPPPPPPPGVSVAVVVSTNDETQLMAAQPSVNFTTSMADAGTNTIVVDSTQQYQSIEGFGAAFTDSAAYLLMQVASSSALPATLNDLFTRNGDGIGLSFMRVPMGASDLALKVYSFDDMPVGQTDFT